MATFSRNRQIRECDLESEINTTTMAEQLIYTKENGGKWWVVDGGVGGTARLVSTGTVPPVRSVCPEVLSAVATSGDYNDLTNKPTLPSAPSYNHAASLTIQTVAAAANGGQVSASRPAIVNYSVTIANTTQIGVASNVSGYVVLEIAETNSATAGDWTEIGRTGNGQNIGLAIALSLSSSAPAQIGGVIPAGYYRRLRSVNVAGTPTYTFNSGQEVLIG